MFLSHPRGGDALFTPPPSCRDERAALLKELESTKAELLDLQLKREKVSWCLADIAESKLRLQELADCLRAALEEEVGRGPGGGQEDEQAAGAAPRHHALLPPEG